MAYINKPNRYSQKAYYEKPPSHKRGSFSRFKPSIFFEKRLSFTGNSSANLKIGKRLCSTENAFRRCLR